MTIKIVNGIQLPAFDVELLTLGKLIAVPFIQHCKEGQGFWLYPSHQLPLGLSTEQYYQPEYLANAKDALSRSATLPIQIKAWGRCEYHWRINPENRHLLPKIAQSTVWNLKALEYIFDRHRVFKLLILRVYHLSKPCIVNVPTEVGAFYWSRSEDVITIGTEQNIPVVSTASFNNRKTLLLAGEAYAHKDLEVLQFQVEQISIHNPAAKQLNHDIKQFLGWSSDVTTKQLDPDLDWINDIAALGDRSKEQDQGKSNYQAGTDFENIVRQSLEFLGFAVDEAYRGGAGGLDLFCSQPYPLVGECKAGKGIPSRTAEELIKLGGMRLDETQFQTAAKLIIGPGKPSSDVLTASQKFRISIINPMTLQKLVNLQAKYPGSINLIELKKYLKPGQIDYRIDEYIQKVESDIKLRSHIVQLVKDYLEKTGFERASLHALHGAYAISNPPQPLKPEALHEILVELSSPLTGYLGRTKGRDGSDRFYYLRDLQVD